MTKKAAVLGVCATLISAGGQPLWAAAGERAKTPAPAPMPALSMPVEQQELTFPGTSSATPSPAAEAGLLNLSVSTLRSLGIQTWKDPADQNQDAPLPAQASPAQTALRQVKAAAAGLTEEKDSAQNSASLDKTYEGQASEISAAVGLGNGDPTSERIKKFLYKMDIIQAFDFHAPHTSDGYNIFQSRYQATQFIYSTLEAWPDNEFFFAAHSMEFREGLRRLADASLETKSPRTEDQFQEMRLMVGLILNRLERKKPYEEIRKATIIKKFHHWNGEIQSAAALGGKAVNAVRKLAVFLKESDHAAVVKDEWGAYGLRLKVLAKHGSFFERRAAKQVVEFVPESTLPKPADLTAQAPATDVQKMLDQAFAKAVGQAQARTGDLDRDQAALFAKMQTINQAKRFAEKDAYIVDASNVAVLSMFVAFFTGMGIGIAGSLDGTIATSTLLAVIGLMAGAFPLIPLTDWFVKKMGWSQVYVKWHGWQEFYKAFQAAGADMKQYQETLYQLLKTQLMTEDRRYAAKFIRTALQQLPTNGKDLPQAETRAVLERVGAVRALVSDPRKPVILEMGVAQHQAAADAALEKAGKAGRAADVLAAVALGTMALSAITIIFAHGSLVTAILTLSALTLGLAVAVSAAAKSIYLSTYRFRTRLAAEAPDRNAPMSASEFVPTQTSAAGAPTSQNQSTAEAAKEAQAEPAKSAPTAQEQNTASAPVATPTAKSRLPYFFLVNMMFSSIISAFTRLAIDIDTSLLTDPGRAYGFLPNLEKTISTETTIHYLSLMIGAASAIGFLITSLLKRYRHSTRAAANLPIKTASQTQAQAPVVASGIAQAKDQPSRPLSQILIQAALISSAVAMVAWIMNGARYDALLPETIQTRDWQAMKDDLLLWATGKALLFSVFVGGSSALGALFLSFVNKAKASTAAAQPEIQEQAKEKPANSFSLPLKGSITHRVVQAAFFATTFLGMLSAATIIQPLALAVLTGNLIAFIGATALALYNHFGVVEPPAAIDHDRLKALHEAAQGDATAYEDALYEQLEAAYLPKEKRKDFIPEAVGILMHWDADSPVDVAATGQVMLSLLRHPSMGAAATQADKALLEYAIEEAQDKAQQLKSAQELGVSEEFLQAEARKTGRVIPQKQ